jgi:hypothetical protein
MDWKNLRERLEEELWEELLERAPTMEPSLLALYAMKEAKLLLRRCDIRLDWSSAPGRAVEAILQRVLMEIVEEVSEVAERRVRDPKGLGSAFTALLASVPLLEDKSAGAPSRAPITAGPALARRVEPDPAPAPEPDESEEETRIALPPPPPSPRTYTDRFLDLLPWGKKTPPPSSGDAKRRARGSILKDGSRALAGGDLDAQFEEVPS